MTANGLLFLFVSFSCVVGVYSNEVDTTCYDNGFEDGLMCSTCIKLEQFTKDSGIRLLLAWNDSNMNELQG